MSLAQLVKQLREATGAGMLECKKALEESNSNLDEAITYLRKKGLSKADKKAGRTAAEGVLSLEDRGDKVALVEINSETDFVAKNDKFQDLVKLITKFILDNDIKDTAALNSSSIDGKSFEEFIKEQIAQIGENIVVRRLIKADAGSNHVIGSYIHGTKVGVVLKAEGANTPENVAILKDVAMHAAAMKPKYLNGDDVPKEFLKKEEDIAKELLEKEGKPADLIAKILPNKVNKIIAENTLLGQKFVKDEKITVEKALKGLKVIEYTRFELGEGIEKESVDFAKEVASQMS